MHEMSKNKYMHKPKKQTQVQKEHTISYGDKIYKEHFSKEDFGGGIMSSCLNPHHSSIKLGLSKGVAISKPRVATMRGRTQNLPQITNYSGKQPEKISKIAFLRTIQAKESPSDERALCQQLKVMSHLRISRDAPLW